MANPKKLWKTTVVIWSPVDPRDPKGWGPELLDLAMEATDGAYYCSGCETVEVADEAQFPRTEFFDNGLDGE